MHTFWLKPDDKYLVIDIPIRGRYKQITISLVSPGEESVLLGTLDYTDYILTWE